MTEFTNTDEMADMPSAIEYVIFRGRLYRNLEFELCHSYSTFALRDQPETEDESYLIELVDSEGRIVNRQAVQVREPVDCGDVLPPYRYVEGQIALRKGAQCLVFRREDLLIAEFEIPPAPSLEVDWGVREVTREKEYRLGLSFSEGFRGSFISLFHTWEPGGVFNLGFFEPDSRISIDFRGLPGGEACRLLILYSNGLRSVTRATEPFQLESLPPTVSIIRPQEGATFTPWADIELEGQVVDPQQAARPEELWWEFGGKKVERGPVGLLETLSEGRHTVTLHYGEEASQQVDFQVSRPEEFNGVPAEHWDDPEYPRSNGSGSKYE